jgi:hypothetical protein
MYHEYFRGRTWGRSRGRQAAPGATACTPAAHPRRRTSPAFRCLSPGHGAHRCGFCRPRVSTPRRSRVGQHALEQPRAVRPRPRLAAPASRRAGPRDHDRIRPTAVATRPTRRLRQRSHEPPAPLHVRRDGPRPDVGGRVDAGWPRPVTSFAVGSARGLPSPAVPATNYAVMFGVLGLVAGVILAAVLRLAQVELQGVGDDLTREAMASVGVLSDSEPPQSRKPARKRSRAARCQCATMSCAFEPRAAPSLASAGHRRRASSRRGRRVEVTDRHGPARRAVSGSAGPSDGRRAPLRGALAPFRMTPSAPRRAARPRSTRTESAASVQLYSVVSVSRASSRYRPRTSAASRYTRTESGGGGRTVGRRRVGSRRPGRTRSARRRAAPAPRGRPVRGGSGRSAGGPTEGTTGNRARSQAEHSGCSQGGVGGEVVRTSCAEVPRDGSWRRVHQAAPECRLAGRRAQVGRRGGVVSARHGAAL